MGINPTNSVAIPMCLVLRSIVLGYRNWSIFFYPRLPYEEDLYSPTGSPGVLNYLFFFHLLALQSIAASKPSLARAVTVHNDNNEPAYTLMPALFEGSVYQAKISSSATNITFCRDHIWLSGTLRMGIL